jgi:hypothetical protein
MQLSVVDGGARSGGWRLAVVGFAAIDVASWALLRRPQRYGLKTRLAVDSLDIAIWSLAPYPRGAGYELAVFIGFPLALEAGLRSGRRALAVPLVPLAATAAARSLAGRPVQPIWFFWLVLGVAAGLLLRRYLGRMGERTEEEWAQRRSAECRRAFLAGQNAVAMGADSVVDAIEGVLPVLGQPESGSVLWEIANAWKPGLREATADHAAYLGLVLSEWAAEHNRHPDLSSRVEVRIAEGMGTTLLTDEQVTLVQRLLTALDLRGAVTVVLEDPETAQRPPGGPVRLRVGDHRLVLPADPNRPPRPYDPAPAAFVITAFVVVGDLLSLHLAPWAAALGFALALGGAVWAQAELRRAVAATRARIVAVAACVAPVYTASATWSLPRRVPHAYPIVAGLDLLALLGGMYWDRLGPAARCWLASGVVLTITTGWSLHHLPRQAGYFALQVTWALPVLIGALKLARELEAGAARYARQLAERDAASEAAAFVEGKEVVLHLVRRARDEAFAHLAQVEWSLPPPLADSARRRLEDVDRRLLKLEAPVEPLP